MEPVPVVISQPLLFMTTNPDHLDGPMAPHVVPVPSSEMVQNVQAQYMAWAPGEPPTDDVPTPAMVQEPATLGADTGPNATHALRHPHKQRIPTSHISKRRDKLTRLLSRRASREKQLNLQRDLKAFHSWHEREIKALASRHNKRIEVIKQLVLKKTSFRPARRPMLQNALVHFKSKELKEKWMPGDPAITLEMIQAAVKIDKANKPPLSRETKREMLEELACVHEIKSMGARALNKAAALDYQCTIKRITWEIKALQERTGAIGFACFSRGHVNDTLFPAWMDSKDSLQFFADVFKITPSDLTRKFEAWAVAQGKGLNYAECTKLIRKECCTLINNGLNSILNRADLEMQYSNYERKICLRFGIHLRGWPADIKFESLSKLNSENARRLRDVLRSGVCIWATMTRQEYRILEDSLEGEPEPQRAPRKDKGKSRGKQQRTVESGVGTQKGAKRPRKKAAKQLPPMQSAEFVENSDSDNSE